MAIPRVKRAIRWAALCGLLLALFAGQALALGLGRIDVKSRAGEPLLAEIQVVSNDPAELDALRARLASPDTFRRIGLPAPDAVLSGLEFSVALDARGRPVIRVTTREPVTQPVLTFLVEVDWGQGRLVREYSALIDTPQTVSAAAQPAIEAPVAAPSNTIVRPPRADPPARETPVASDATSREDLAAEAARDASAAATAQDEEAGSRASPVAPTPAPPAAPAPAPAAAERPAGPGSAASADEYGPVRAGETLGEIAQRLAGDGVRREQAIVALYRANPGAFIANNLNLVREGAVLRIPDRAEIAGLDLAESRALMREQIAAWREMTRPAPQPGDALAGEGGAGAPDAAGEAAAAPAAPSVPVADARLEIVPPSASGAQQAGTRSGIQAGGEGEMLRQELQQELVESRETLAARSAEVEELKARVADLERLQAQQAQLIELKDSELAAAQERLATTGAAAPGDATAPAADPAGLPWLWIGLALVAVAAVAWLLARRTPKATPRPRFASAPAATGADGAASSASDVDMAETVPFRDVPAEAASTPAPVAPAPSAPAWHASSSTTPSSAGIAPAADVDATPARATPVSASGVPEVEDASASVGNERIELARAYLDLGDTDTARELLREVAEDGDADSRAEATRLLAGIA